MKLDSEDYLRHLASESSRFREVLSSCEPSARVPGCPDWNAADLLWHLTEVQDFWAHVVTHRPKAPDDYPDPKRPSGHTEMLAVFDERSRALQDALAAAEAPDEAWTWSTEQTVGFIMRRQALEALVHRVDAEQAAGAESPLDAALAADGVDEVLDVMYGGCPPWGSFSPLPHYLRLDITDTDEQVWVQLGRFSGDDAEGTHHDEDDIHVVADPGVEPDAVISGAAAPLLTRLWRRGDGSEIHLAGDLKIVDHFRQVIHQPIN
ncbi:maleylpyruvate isomerase family mycothiol-dependent enzyme [Nocardioides coralli]|uniref:maleylpyruvate isomerase family mycothiol-dependent enzyme n=1 Tax=Nocardioides coralli TaxID=2872154 RepID=UPI001CA4531E|nr:maleylpyruvate isomerase family mycothiol-dependent enzyme [Nocardioides coralli]QZY30560.1 maleylpyruvate isomerase family mycothiol-dependent enzyme [Nocardioides coralli]